MSRTRQTHGLRRSRGFVAPVGAGLLVAASVGFGAALLLTHPAGPETLAPAPVVSTVPVQKSTFTGSAPVDVSVTQGPDVFVSSPVAGVISDLSCDVGSPLASGTVLFSVNGVPILGLSTRMPLWRDVVLGDTGRDVDALENAMEALRPGTVTVNGRWGKDDQASYLALRKSVSADAASDQQGVIAREIVWIPSGAAVSGCSVGPGRTVAQGDAVFSMPSDVLSATVHYAQEPPVQGARVLMVGKEKYALPDTGTISDSSALAAIGSSAEYKQMQASKGTSLKLQSMLESPIEVIAAPPLAVYEDPQGHTCISTEEGPLSVTVVASELGMTLVQTARDVSVLTVSTRPDDDDEC